MNVNDFNFKMVSVYSDNINNYPCIQSDTPANWPVWMQLKYSDLYDWYKFFLVNEDIQHRFLNDLDFLGHVLNVKFDRRRFLETLLDEIKAQLSIERKKLEDLDRIRQMILKRDILCSVLTVPSYFR